MHVEHGLELNVGHLEQRRIPVKAGVVDDDVQTAERLESPFDESRRRLGRRHVADHGLGAALADVGADLVHRVGVGSVHHHPRALGGEQLSGGAADAARRPGDQGGTTVEEAHVTSVARGRGGGIRRPDDATARSVDVPVI
jgi:hypothetical protein